jgi:hypothetical protein
MHQRQPTNLAASVRQRLYNLARARGEELQLVLTRYGIERLLYRLSHTPGGERFVLKGAVLFYVWEGAPHRPTRDVDFWGSGDSSPENLATVFRAVCVVEVEPDGLTFLPEGVAVEPIRDRQEYGGVRVTLTAMLGGARIPLQIDVGFGDAITPGPRIEMIPTLLDFPAPRVRTYPPETVIAEKFQAMVSLGIANTRLKDFFDVWTLCQTQEFDGTTIGDTPLAEAIGATFERRNTLLPDRAPLALTDAFGRDPEKQAQWRRFLARGHITGVPEDLAPVVQRIAGFVLPPALARSRGVPFVMRWIPARGWEPRPG